MGLTLCSARAGSETLYDIRTQTQGTMFLCYAGVYTVVEGVFLAMTIKLFCANVHLFRNFYAFVFYCAFHLTLLCSAIYFLGGIICYGEVVYVLVANLPYLFQGLSVLVLIVQMANSHQLISPDENGRGCSYNLCALALSLVYIALFGVLMWTEMREGRLHYFYVYNVVCHVGLALVLLRQSRHLYIEIVERYPTFLNILRRRAWRGIMVTITTLMFSRSGMAACNVAGINDFLKRNHHGLFTLYKMVFFMAFELFPCIAFMFFMHMQLSAGDTHKCVRASGDLEAYRTQKKRWHSPACSFSLAEEMVDNEGIDQE